jgi:hypothetical protein
MCFAKVIIINNQLKYVINKYNFSKEHTVAP